MSREGNELKGQLIGFGIFLVLIAAACGIGAAFDVLGEVLKIFIGFFPFIAEVAVVAIEDYLQSAYFWVSVVLFVLSSVGIYLSYREKKILYGTISFICDVASIVSMIANFANCTY